MNKTAYEISFSNDQKEFSMSYPNALNMGIYIENMYVKSGHLKGWFNVSDKNGILIYSAVGVEAIEDTWTQWGYGDNLTINYLRICKVIGDDKPGYRSPAQVKSVALLESMPIALNESEEKKKSP